MSSREGHDLFHRFGRRHFWDELRRGRFNGNVWRDTFGQVLCWFKGHDRYDSEDGEVACRRCCKYVDAGKVKP